MSDTGQTADVTGLERDSYKKEFGAFDGPGTGFNIMFMAELGQKGLEVLDTAPDDRGDTDYNDNVYQWYLLSFPGGKEGWVRGDALTISGTAKKSSSSSSSTKKSEKSIKDDSDDDKKTESKKADDKKADEKKAEAKDKESDKKADGKSDKDAKDKKDDDSKSKKTSDGKKDDSKADDDKEKDS